MFTHNGCCGTAGHLLSRQPRVVVLIWTDSPVRGGCCSTRPPPRALLHHSRPARARRHYVRARASALCACARIGTMCVRAHRHYVRARGGARHGPCGTTHGRAPHAGVSAMSRLLAPSYGTRAAAHARPARQIHGHRSTPRRPRREGARCRHGGNTGKRGRTGTRPNPGTIPRRDVPWSHVLQDGRRLYSSHTTLAEGRILRHGRAA
jgi:hypothetical protein